MFKKFKNFMAIFIVATFIMPQSILAYSKYVVVGGENIGLQINNKGIIVAGFYKIGDVMPSKNSYLNKGDTIIQADNKSINSIDDFISVIKNSNGESLNITYTRGNSKKNTTLTLVNDDGVIKTGLYIKDTVSGIGTLTFIDPKTKLFGALGHEVFESSTGVMINVKDGKIYNSNVTSIDKSTRGDPGSKNATVNSNDIYGSINENTKSGIFGKYTKEFNNIINNVVKIGEWLAKISNETKNKYPHINWNIIKDRALDEEKVGHEMNVKDAYDLASKLLKEELYDKLIELIKR